MVTTTTAVASSLRARPTTTLSELSDVLADQARHRHDFKANTGDMHVSEEDGTLCVRSAGWKEFELRPTALSQLCTKIGVPQSYVSKCPTGLMAENLNYWLHNSQHRDVMLRCDGDSVRAMLSTRYQPIDHTDLARWLVTTNGPDTALRYELTDDELVVQIVDDRSETVGRGDTLHPGIGVRNSETGLSAVEITGLIYRTICLNGLILSGQQQQWRRRHIGNADLAGEVQLAVAQARESGQRGTRTFGSTQNIIVPEIGKLFEKVAERYALTDNQCQAIQWAFTMEPGESLFSAVNAVTRAAHHDDLNLNQRRHLQEVGGRMLAHAESGRSWLG